MRGSLRTLAIPLVVVTAALAAVPAYAGSPITRLVSRAPGGDPADGHSSDGVPSAGGKLVAFVSEADNLGGEPDIDKVFVRNMQSGAVELISKTSTGDPANGPSSDPAISESGRFVAFASDAGNLPGGDGATTQVFVHDRQSGNTLLVSKTNGGAPGNDDSDLPSISRNGQVIAFRTDADNLGGDPSHENVVVRNRQAGTTRLVSQTTGGNPANSWSEDPSITPNGRWVSFDSNADNFPGMDGVTDIFIRDLQAGTTKLVSRTTGGNPSNGNSYDSTISGTGRYVVFESSANNLGGAPGTFDIFIRDLQASTTRLVSRTTGGAPANDDSNDGSISANGKVVAFMSNADNLGGDPDVTNVFIRDLVRDRTFLGSKNSDGDPADGFNQLVRSHRVLTANGSRIVFSSDAANLPGDTAAQDVYIRGPLPV
jgi:Tol biopolymer transport system component